jgi:hypothetical protein
VLKEKEIEDKDLHSVLRKRRRKKKEEGKGSLQCARGRGDQRKDFSSLLHNKRRRKAFSIMCWLKGGRRKRFYTVCYGGTGGGNNRIS